MANDIASKNETRAVLSIASGKSVYWDMAINLARSFLWWHKDSPIRFCIATDLDMALPEDLRSVYVIRLTTAELGQGFSAKLQLDRLAPAECTLFIDADCLCMGNLDSVFERFAGRAVAVIGGSISQGDWFGDVAVVLRHFGLIQMPKFNGGIYYLERGAIANSVYANARDLEKQYDELGLVRLRGRPNDELLLAISMALHGLESIPDDGTIMSDPQECPGRLYVDVLEGESSFLNPPPPDPRHQPWYPFTEVRPLVGHFLGDYTNKWQYQAERRKLELVLADHVSPALARLRVNLGYSIAARAQEAARNLLRPLYRQVFGIRPVKVSERI